MAKAPEKPVKKKICTLCKEKVQHVDYKDAMLLRTYVSDRGKIRSRRITGACVQHQSKVANAVKTCREVALMPYTTAGR